VVRHQVRAWRRALRRIGRSKHEPDAQLFGFKSNSIDKLFDTVIIELE
jgi:hypothetical protein